MSEPASIRYKNPSAMWPGPRATEWGSTEWVQLHDAQKNKIAVFPTFVQGAAAAFDLWDTNYTGKTLAADILKWSGHNSSKSYAQYLLDNAGVGLTQVITRDLLSSERGWKLLKAQSHWEAGKAIPMSDDEWQQAQAMVFKNQPQPIVLPYLRFGDQGDFVRKMQGLLKISADGNFGKQTLKALMTFQNTHDLRDDGICGPLTWEALGATH